MKRTITETTVKKKAVRSLTVRQLITPERERTYTLVFLLTGLRLVISVFNFVIVGMLSGSVPIRWCSAYTLQSMPIVIIRM